MTPVSALPYFSKEGGGGGGGCLSSSSGVLDLCNLNSDLESGLDAVGSVDAFQSTAKALIKDNSFKIPDWMKTAGNIVGKIGVSKDAYDITCMLARKDYGTAVLAGIKLAVTTAFPVTAIAIEIVSNAIDPSKATLPPQATDSSVINCGPGRDFRSEFIEPEEKLGREYFKFCVGQRCITPDYYTISEGLTHISNIYNCNGTNCIPTDLANITEDQLTIWVESVASSFNQQSSPHYNMRLKRSEARSLAAFLIMTNALKHYNTINTDIFFSYMRKKGYSSNYSNETIIESLTPSIPVEQYGRIVKKAEWEVPNSCEDMK